MPRRSISPSAQLVLDTMAQHGGSALVTHGVRYRYASGEFVAVMSGALHTLLHDRLITDKGQNEKGRYRWTERGYEAWWRGSVEAKSFPAHWLSEKPEPFSGEAQEADCLAREKRRPTPRRPAWMRAA